MDLSVNVTEFSQATTIRSLSTAVRRIDMSAAMVSVQFCADFSVGNDAESIELR